MTDRTAEQVEREFVEATALVKRREAEETVKLAEISDVGLRTAKVALACAEEIDHYHEVLAEREALNVRRTERWIDAHEVLGFQRTAAYGGQAPQ